MDYLALSFSELHICFLELLVDALGGRVRGLVVAATALDYWVLRLVELVALLVVVVEEREVRAPYYLRIYVLLCYLGLQNDWLCNLNWLHWLSYCGFFWDGLHLALWPRLVAHGSGLGLEGGELRQILVSGLLKVICVLNHFIRGRPILRTDTWEKITGMGIIFLNWLRFCMNNFRSGGAILQFSLLVLNELILAFHLLSLYL